METFVKLFNQGYLGIENKLYDKDKLEVLKVRDICIFKEMLQAIEKSESCIEPSSQEKCLMEYAAIVEEEKNYKNSTIYYVITIIFLFSGLFIVGASYVFDYFLMYSMDIQKLIVFLLKNMAMGIISAFVVMFFVWIAFKGSKRKGIIVLASIIIAGASMFRGHNSFRAFTQEKELESRVNIKIVEMSTQYLSQNPMEHQDFDNNTYGDFSQELELTEKFFIKTQKDLIDIKNSEAYFYTNNKLTADAYRTVASISEIKANLDKYNADIITYTAHFSDCVEDYKKQRESFSTTNYSKQKLIKVIRLIAVDSGQKVLDYYKDTMEDGKKLQAVLMFMEQNREKYIVTASGVRFLNENDKDIYMKLLDSFYNKKNS